MRATDIFHAVLIVGGVEENRARTAALRHAVDGHLHDALLHDDDFLVGMAVGGVRDFAGVQRGDVAFEIGAGDGR